MTNTRRIELHDLDGTGTRHIFDMTVDGPDSEGAAFRAPCPMYYGGMLQGIGVERP
jgi:hypothetical protein